MDEDESGEQGQGTGRERREYLYYFTVHSIRHLCVCAAAFFSSHVNILYLYFSHLFYFEFSGWVSWRSVAHGGTARPGPGPGLFLSPELFLASNDCSLLIGL